MEKVGLTVEKSSFKDWRLPQIGIFCIIFGDSTTIIKGFSIQTCLFRTGVHAPVFGQGFLNAQIDFFYKSFFKVRLFFLRNPIFATVSSGAHWWQ